MEPSRERYFDNAATTPVDPRVLAEMLPHLGRQWGNPSSIHACCRRANDALARARERVAGLLGAEDPAEIVFTAAASEANNWVISQFDSGWIGPFEHPSVRAPAHLRGYGTLSSAEMNPIAPLERRALASVMAVQNEWGGRFDLSALRSWGECAHSDVTQALGRVPVELAHLDFASFSGHKLYGPMGVGGLYRRGTPALVPLIVGGGQEQGQRAGTLNVPGIVGFGMACALAAEEREKDSAHAAHLRGIIKEVLEGVPDWRSVESNSQSPFILAVMFLGLHGETLVLDLDRKGFCASSGSACSSGHAEPWASLVAMGIEPEWALGAVRLSFGRYNSPDSAKAVAAALADSVAALRRLHEPLRP